MEKAMRLELIRLVNENRILKKKLQRVASRIEALYKEATRGRNVALHQDGIFQRSSEVGRA